MSNEPQTILSNNAIAGRWYQSEKHGRVLCCGTANPGELIMAFAVRNSLGQTQMKYLYNVVLNEAPQSWD